MAIIAAKNKKREGKCVFLYSFFCPQCQTIPPSSHFPCLHCFHTSLSTHSQFNLWLLQPLIFSWACLSILNTLAPVSDTVFWLNKALVTYSMRKCLLTEIVFIMTLLSLPLLKAAKTASYKSNLLFLTQEHYGWFSLLSLAPETSFKVDELPVYSKWIVWFGSWSK